jgi:hypothetical protein
MLSAIFRSCARLLTGTVVMGEIVSSNGLGREVLDLARDDGQQPSGRGYMARVEAEFFTKFARLPEWAQPEAAAQLYLYMPVVQVADLSDAVNHRLTGMFREDPQSEFCKKAMARMRDMHLRRNDFTYVDSAEQDRRYFEQIEDMGGKQVADTTAAFINGMEEFGPMHLLTDTQIKMMRALQVSRERTPETDTARTSLHSFIDAGEAYYEAERKTSEGIADTLAGDRKVQKALSNWQNMDDDARLGVLKHVAALHCEQAGFGPVEIELADWPASGGRMRKGSFNQHAQKIRINRAVANFWDDPVKVIGTTVHENHHNRQMQLGKAFEDRQLQPGDRDYVAAAVLNDGFQHGYIQSSLNHEQYRDQLVEKTARHIQSRVERRLDDLGLKRDLSADAELRALLDEWDRKDGKTPEVTVVQPQRRRLG